jgi:hypothetical protein
MPRAFPNSNGRGRELFPAAPHRCARSVTPVRQLSGFMTAAANECVPIAAKFDIHPLNL